MKPLIKKILIAASLIVGGSMLLAYEKTKRLQAIFDKITIRPHGLPKKITATLSEISFDIDIILTNPTGEDFAVSGYVATLKQVVVYFKGQFLGLAHVNIDEISVPRQDTLILHNIHIVVATSELLENIMTLIPEFSNMTLDTINDLQFTGIVEVLGINYEIG